MHAPMRYGRALSQPYTLPFARTTTLHNVIQRKEATMSDTHTHTTAPCTDDATNAQADTSSNTERAYEALFSRNNVSAATRSHALTRRNFLGATLAGLSVVSLGALAGCAGNKPAPSKEPEKKAADPKKTTWEFTDQIDQKVSVQIPVERMVVLQHHSIDILAQLGAQKKVIAVEKNWEKDLGGYIKDVFPGIASLPNPGSLSDWNVETIASLKPDVVIAASQANPKAMKQIRDLGIPVCVVSLRAEGKQQEAQNPRLSNADAAYTNGCKWAVETLGKLTGTSDKANLLWKFCKESRDQVERAIGSIDDAKRTKVFVACPDNKTYGNDKYVGCQLLRAGAINVAAKDIQGYKPYTFEMLAKWDPDMIIVQDRYKSVYDAILASKPHQQLKAVKNKKVVLAPYWTKPWGNPDADSIALGELWLAHMFYPEKISKDLVLERAKAFYKTFYGTDFKGTM